MTNLLAGVGSWTSATAAFVLAFAGSLGVVYPTLSFAADAVAFPFPGVVGLAAFALAFGASYPLVAGGWSIPRLYDVLLVAACCTVLVSVVLAGVATATTRAGTWPQPATATGLWVLSLGIASLAVFRFDFRVFA